MVLSNPFLFMAGVGFLALAKSKSMLRGYSSPKPFGFSEMQRCIDYDVNVVDEWLRHLEEYTNEKNYFSGKSVLELGPGSDLGTGLYLLYKGCSQYNACDVNDLVKSSPNAFYDELFKKFQSIDGSVDISLLKEQLELSRKGEKSSLNYLVRNDFDLVSAFGEESIDIVFSQAAFEHFDDVEETISHLSKVCKPGAVLTVQVDLKAHSRWIRDKDPNNIYRFPQWLYQLFYFRGIPNRVRPYQYKEAFERFGWQDVSVTPLKTLKNPKNAYSGMNHSFTDEKNQMEYLSIMICAKKS